MATHITTWLASSSRGAASRFSMLITEVIRSPE